MRRTDPPPTWIEPPIVWAGVVAAIFGKCLAAIGFVVVLASLDGYDASILDQIHTAIVGGSLFIGGLLCALIGTTARKIYRR